MDSMLMLPQFYLTNLKMRSIFLVKMESYYIGDWKQNMTFASKSLCDPIAASSEPGRSQILTWCFEGHSLAVSVQRTWDCTKSLHYLKSMRITKITWIVVQCVNVVLLRAEGILIGLKRTLCNTLWELLVLNLTLYLLRSRVEMIFHW